MLDPSPPSNIIWARLVLLTKPVILENGISIDTQLPDTNLGAVKWLNVWYRHRH